MRPAKIGMMDWGIGGLSVYRALRDQGRTSDVLYLSDAGTIPYGKLSKGRLRERFVEIAEFFRARAVHRVLVACHAASSALESNPVSGLETIGDVSFQSILPSAVETARHTQAAHLGVIGGDLTIQSGIYQRALAGLGKQLSFCPAQPLSAMVEAGELDSPAVEIAVRTVVDKLPGIDALLLACTHYPALKPVIARVFPHVQILDPGAAMASSVHEQGSKAFEFFTTGRQGDSARAALLAFGVEIGVGGRALQYCLPPT